jgi:hypothetical protein
MQRTNRKTRSSLAAVIGFSTTNNFRGETKMNTTTLQKIPATKAKLSAVTIDSATLTRAESRMLSAARKLDESDFEFIVGMMEIHAHNHPAAAFVKPKQAFRLVQGGAA